MADEDDSGCFSRSQTDGQGFHDPLVTLPFHPRKPGPLKQFIQMSGSHIIPRYLAATRHRVVTDFPANPRMVTFDQRLLTFEDWPRRCPVKPLELARAGLYYVGYLDGILDCVRCFWCDFGFCMWEEGDTAKDEHLKHNPNCEFISTLK